MKKHFHTKIKRIFSYMIFLYTLKSELNIKRKAIKFICCHKCILIRYNICIALLVYCFNYHFTEGCQHQQWDNGTNDEAVCNAPKTAHLILFLDKSFPHNLHCIRFRFIILTGAIHNPDRNSSNQGIFQNWGCSLCSKCKRCAPTWLLHLA